MKKIIFIAVILIQCSSFVFSYNSLSVGDPRNTWYTAQGTIEEATFSVKPKGIYMEMGMYLTFSARNTYFTSYDSLEVVLNFELPLNAIVDDSWLWIGDTIIRAKVMDKWTASSIYEGIVNRRQDPSILTKISNTQYTLRVFPMRGNETRKVKITYLIPTDWNRTSVYSKIPASILSSSYNALPFFKLLTWPDATWTNPHIMEYPGFLFSAYNDQTFGDYYYTEIPKQYYNSSLNLAYNSPMTNGVFVNTYSNQNDNLYQMAILPSLLLDSIQHNNIAVLIDYDASNSTISKSTIFSVIKQNLYEQLTPQDSFNIIVSNFSIFRASNVWIPADSASIEAAFTDLANHLSNYSNMTSLLSNGINFIQTNGNYGKIILVSNSDEYGSSTVANSLINDILSLMDPYIPIYIADFQTQNYSYYNNSGQYYYGNEYFYSKLSMITLGAFYKCISTGYTITDVFKLNLNEAWGTVNSFDLYTSVASGYCYGRYNMSSQSSSVYLNKPILQVGKYYGSLPFKINISGEYNFSVFNKEIIIDTQDINQSDSTAKAIWAGAYIKDLESQTQTNNLIENIIHKSITSRVLSKYTAFLCLEDTAMYCMNCADESELLEIEQDSLQNTEIAITSFPNPFNDVVSFKISAEKNMNYADATYKIYNMQGAVVKEFNYSEAEKNNEILFTWNTNTDIAKGIYFFVMTTGKNTKTLKIVRM